MSFGPAYQIQCLEQDTLRELWRADLPNESGAYNRLEQDGENVYVLAQGRALAFKIANGKRLWATDEFTSGAFFRPFGTSALTHSGHFILEWRDTLSGEVIGVWGNRETGFAHDAVLIGKNVLVEWTGDAGDSLRLMTLPNEIDERFTRR